MGRERTVVTFLIVVAVLVCLAGVLILPQVDLPAFVLNGSKNLTALAAHAKRISSWSVSNLFDISNSTLRQKQLYGYSPSGEDAGAHFVPEALLVLRC